MARSQKQRRPVVEEDDDNEEMEVVEYEETDLDRKAYDLVRLALFNEHKRTPLRREDITKKVLGSNSRAFNAVLELAQRKLRTTFGMELVELPTRAGLSTIDSSSAAADKDLEQAQKATAVRKKTTALLSKTYILRSTLDSRLIEQAALANDRILALEDPDKDNLEVDDDDGEPPRTYGSIIAWSTADHLAALGILHIVLALILVSGRAIPDNDLRAHLRRLNLNSTIGSTPIPLPSTSTARGLSLDAYLTQLLKQGFLDQRPIAGSATAKGKGRSSQAAAKRSRAAGDEGDGEMYEWRWGPRAFKEVGEKELAMWVAEFMIGDEDGDDAEEEEQEERVQRRGGKKDKARNQRDEDERNGKEEKLKKMFADVERAAAGHLVDVNGD